MNYDKHLYEILEIYEKSSPQKEEEINIFRILNLEYDEVRLHSRILKFLIEKDPNGFVNSIPQEYWNGIGKPTGSLLKVILEKPCSSSNEEIKDGRIDLIVDFEQHMVLIENKIYASDQDEQLVKYYDYGEKLGKKFILLYLTLDGIMPSENSLFSLNQNRSIKKGEFQLISYKKEIINWLIKYKSEIENQSGFEAINELARQYISTLNKICFKMTPEHKERIKKLLEKEDLLNHVFQIKFDIDTIQNKIHEFWRKVSENIDIPFEEIKQVKIDFREGSIMINLFNNERGQFNLYLEYATNFNEMPFLGIWLNKKHLLEFSKFNLDDKGFILKESVNDIFTKEIFIKYLDCEDKSLLELVSSKTIEAVKSFIDKYSSEIENLSAYKKRLI